MNENEKTEELKASIPDLRVGYTVKLYYKFKEKDKERIQPFEGTIIAKKGGGISEMMTIRGSLSGVMMERIIPVHSPNIDKVEIIKKGKARRAKLYYLRSAVGKRARLKRKEESPDLKNKKEDESEGVNPEERKED